MVEIVKKIFQHALKVRRINDKKMEQMY